MRRCSSPLESVVVELTLLLQGALYLLLWTRPEAIGDSCCSVNVSEAVTCLRKERDRTAGAPLRTPPAGVSHTLCWCSGVLMLRCSDALVF